jgi:heat-inducible transcriptional repressor
MQPKTEKPNDRALAILKTVVEKYIREGQPVGSKALAEESAIGLSSASIRNIMADLEDAGYLHSPHTSAGRIPTSEGYRLFVNTLLTVQPLELNQINQLRSKLNSNVESSALVESASNLLSSVTKLAGIVTVPRREHFTLRHVEFLQLSQNRVLAILVFNDREIQNRIIYTDRLYTASELQQAGNFVTQMYAGKSLPDIRQDLVGAIRTERERMRTILHTAMDIAEKAFEEENQESCIIAGETNLIALAEEAGIDRLRSLFEALNQKRDILHLLDGCLTNDGVQIFIGKESGHEVLDECSIVTAPYSSEGKVVGVLGVIGPTRMAYDHVISAVDVTAKLLSAALSE